MKALTLQQPWAQLVAVGAKRWETRSWRTAYRGPLAIHAAAHWRPASVQGIPWALALAIPPSEWDRLPRGAVVAVAHLADCVPVAAVDPRGREALFGDFTPGRWAWRLEDVRPLAEPLAARGRLGIWDIEFPV